MKNSKRASAKAPFTPVKVFEGETVGELPIISRLDRLFVYSITPERCVVRTDCWRHFYTCSPEVAAMVAADEATAS